jgi:hypothetical protein
MEASAWDFKSISTVIQVPNFRGSTSCTIVLINSYLFGAVIIERQPAPADQPNPVHQRTVEPPNGVWVRSGGMPDFIKTLYWNILDRNPESQLAIDNWTRNTLTHGLAHTVGSLFTTEEYASKEMSAEATADKFYLAVMGREAEPAEREHWAKRIRDGISLRKVPNYFVADLEYRAKVEDGRAPDPIHWPNCG